MQRYFGNFVPVNLPRLAGRRSGGRPKSCISDLAHELLPSGRHAPMSLAFPLRDQPVLACLTPETLSPSFQLTPGAG